MWIHTTKLYISFDKIVQWKGIRVRMIQLRFKRKWGVRWLRLEFKLTQSVNSSLELWRSIKCVYGKFNERPFTRWMVYLYENFLIATLSDVTKRLNNPLLLIKAWLRDETFRGSSFSHLQAFDFSHFQIFLQTFCFVPRSHRLWQGKSMKTRKLWLRPC